jgi:hypothetical protein
MPNYTVIDDLQGWKSKRDEQFVETMMQVWQPREMKGMRATAAMSMHGLMTSMRLAQWQYEHGSQHANWTRKMQK